MCSIKERYMRFNPKDYLNQLPLPVNEKWKDGVWDVEVFKHGSLLLDVFKFAQGDVLCVPAGKRHRFLEPLNGIQTWAVFYGPKGGE